MEELGLAPNHIKPRNFYKERPPCRPPLFSPFFSNVFAKIPVNIQDFRATFLKFLLNTTVISTFNITFLKFAGILQSSENVFGKYDELLQNMPPSLAF